MYNNKVFNIIKSSDFQSRITGGSAFTGIKTPEQSDSTFWQVQLTGDGSLARSKYNGSSFAGWDKFLAESDLKIQHGTVSMQCAAGETTSQDITFTESFSETPIVCLTATSGVPNAVMLTTTGVTRSKCTINMWRNRDDALNINWVAIGK